MTAVSSTPSSIHVALGLTDPEYNRICELLDREPNHLELAMYAVMWSEHCSYKSSRRHLARLPTEAPCVLVGPGENAGVVDVGDGIAVALRIESHNHPSAIEPYQGAATGVGGILRDIFTMGARPIALADPLRVGPLEEPRSNWIAEGIVSGISGYGNSVGVPTIAGEFVSCETYRDNPLVNVAALGIMPTERLVLGRATEVGSLAVLMGASTGRDGIGGVSVLASAGFDEGADDAAKRPSVQVGDPFEEKRLIEACLEMLDAGLVSGIQDLGGAGLTCAASETASRGGTGMEVDVTAVPLRQVGMAPFEIMTSESQERMLAIVSPGNVDQVRAICEAWEVTATVVGRVTGDGMLRVRDGADGEVLAEIPAATLHDDAPTYDRPMRLPADMAARRDVDPTAGSGDASPGECAEDLLAMLADPRWVYRQYDHQLFCNTVVGPGHDATLLRLRDPRSGTPTGRGLAVSVDGNHRWCDADPGRGTAMVVIESAMNLACVGADPLALVNCLNFGNPTHPEVMWQLSEAIDGMTEACDALGVPVVGGNVSLYNETNGINISPTPVVCMIGIHPELVRRPVPDSLRSGTELLLLAAPEIAPGNIRGPQAPSAQPIPLGGSRWAWERRHCRDGALPVVDLPGAVATARFVAAAVRDKLVLFAHDVSDGGIGLAIAEMCCHGGAGVQARIPPLGASAPAVRALFAEPLGRVLAAVEGGDVERLARVASSAGVECRRLGRFGGSRVQIGRPAEPGYDIDLALADTVVRWRGALPQSFAGPIDGAAA
ncbi:phosphoribosylformylglycinamidine synthase subunit PurL [Candidatus Poriferisodalis sp.]|uniref:phosphoribosylformylglycinamidine synthase subunit PurL n=1 Tax=Candidatus Poriferisodalis sp. TaxID=3101277 RepID=UPI003B5ACC84